MALHELEMVSERIVQKRNDVQKCSQVKYSVLPSNQELLFFCAEQFAVTSSNILVK